jgi:hypothetical protein
LAGHVAAADMHVERFATLSHPGLDDPVGYGRADGAVRLLALPLLGEADVLLDPYEAEGEPMLQVRSLGRSGGRSDMTAAGWIQAVRATSTANVPDGQVTAVNSLRAFTRCSPSSADQYK